MVSSLQSLASLQSGDLFLDRLRRLTAACSGVALLLVACNSSPTIDSRSPRDAGPGDGAVTKDAARVSADGPAVDAAKTCSPFGEPDCQRGQTCCTSDFMGACTELAACTSKTQFQCSGSHNCAAGEVCCGTFVDS